MTKAGSAAAEVSERLDHAALNGNRCGRVDADTGSSSQLCVDSSKSVISLPCEISNVLGSKCLSHAVCCGAVIGAMVALASRMLPLLAAVGLVRVVADPA